MEMEDIKIMKEGVPIQLKHTLREGNMLSDFFANMTVNFAGTYMVESFQDLSIIAGILLNMGKCSMPHRRLTQLP